MNITVLGGSGFIGTRLVGALQAAGHRVRILDRRPSTAHPELVVIGDVRDAAAVDAVLAHCDCVINLAAEHGDDVQPASLYFDVNVGGAEQVVRAADAQGVRRIVFVSSVAVYGLEQPLADESSAIRPGNDYGRSKAQAEAVYRGWAAQSAAQRSLVLLRPSVVFGEGNHGNVYNLIDHIRRHRFVMVGSGDNRKSIAYVGNLVDFILTRLDADPGTQLFNYADKPDPSTRELVGRIRTLLPGHRRTRVHLPYAVALAAGYLFDAAARLSGRSLSISSTRVRKFCADTRIATTALEREGFVARVSIDEGLARMIAHLRRHEPIAGDDAPPFPSA